MKDSCSKIADWLEPYLDGELGLKKARQVERHLATCQCCQKEAEDLKAVAASLRAALADPEGEARLEGLWPAIAREAAETPFETGSLLSRWAGGPTAWLRLHWQPAFGLVAALLLIIGTLFVYRPGFKGQVVPGEVTILSLESSGPVLVFNPPPGEATVIWLFY